MQPQTITENELIESDFLCKICKQIIGERGHYDHQRHVDVGVCATCDRWIELWQHRDDETVIRIDGVHYMYGNHLQDYVVNLNDSLVDIVENWQPKKTNGLGMGGSKHVFQMNDGRIVITNDLWHQGDIPKEFRKILPDNAKRIEL